jgi:hypothetical protein
VQDWPEAAVPQGKPQSDTLQPHPQLRSLTGPLSEQQMIWSVPQLIGQVPFGTQPPALSLPTSPQPT